MRYYGTTNNTPAHQAPPVWRAPEGLEDLTAAQVGGGRAWPGFETTRRAQLAARTASGRAAAHRHTQRPGPTKQATRRQGLAGLREDTPSQSSAHPAPLVWRTPGARPRCRWAAAGPSQASRSTTLNRLFALWGVGVVFEASRGSWTVLWDDDRTQEFALGASSTKTRT